MNWTLSEETRDGYTVSTDPARLDVDAMHAFLTRCYWSPGIPREVVARAAAGSLCFGLYRGAAQVGLARMITDGATFAYLCDVYVLEEHRGHGRGRWLTVPGATVHLYGKGPARPGRKMGHVTQVMPDRPKNG